MASASGEVERVAGLVVGGGVLVVDVHPVEAVRAQERHHRVGERVDAGGVDRVGAGGGHPVEAAGVEPVAVVVDEAAGLGPAADADQRADVRVLLLVLVEQVEVPGVGQGRVHLGAGHAGPGHVRGRVVRGGRVADGDLVVAVDVRERVVDVGDLLPRDLVDQVGGGAVAAGPPTGEVADDPAGVVRAHLLPAGGVVDGAVGHRHPGRAVEPVGPARLVVGDGRSGVRGGHHHRHGRGQQTGGAGRQPAADSSRQHVHLLHLTNLTVKVAKCIPASMRRDKRRIFSRAGRPAGPSHRAAPAAAGRSRAPGAAAGPAAARAAARRPSR